MRSVCSNSIYVVEKFIRSIDQGYNPFVDEVLEVSRLFGERTKKVDVVYSRYLDVFSKLIQKNCAYTDKGDLCIYSWNPRAYIRYYPLSIDATGTILLITGDRIELVAYPIHRSHDIEGHRVRIYKPSEKAIVEISRRIDGYHITFYYNPLLKKWVPATRYVLHNMRYMGKRFIVENLDEIINPYCFIADKIASEQGLYDKFKGFNGWTFSFVLKPPEPAILKPNVELYDPSDFKLYLVSARKPDGTLLTISDSGELLKWDTVPLEHVIDDDHVFEELVEKARHDLHIRSIFIRYIDDDHCRPYTVEVKSKLYPEAMAVKYMSSPKSLILLASHGLGEEAVSLLTSFGDIRAVGKEIIDMYEELYQHVSTNIDSDIVEQVLRELDIYSKLKGELTRARRKGGVGRFVRKLSILLSGETIYEARDNIKKAIELFRKLGGSSR